jgi:hypothetical protein
VTEQPIKIRNGKRSYSPSVSGLLWCGVRAGYWLGSRAAGSQGLPLNRARRASSLLMSHLAAVDR